MDPKPNFNNDLFDIIYDKDLVVENEILKVKLEEADKVNTFLRDEVKDLRVLLNAKIQNSSHNFKTTGLVSSVGASLTSWEGASLALVGHPSSDGVTIKMPFGLDVLHRPAFHPIFSHWVG